MNKFFLSCIQSERRLHIKATTLEMFQVSALLYGGISAVAIFAMLFPTWSAMDKQSILIASIFGLLHSFVFYTYRSVAPLWLALIHIPIGVVIGSYVIYLGHAPQAVGINIIYVLNSAYLFHYITVKIAVTVLIFAMTLFAFVLYSLGIEGWPSMVVFTSGNCFLMGLLIWLMTRRIYKLNIKDSLTGLFNRQTIDAIAQNLIDLYLVKNKSFTFIMIDLNNFKIINDTKGHLEGDKVLIQFSRALENSINEEDHVARWGGDEFIVILCSHNEHAIQLFETTIRQNTIDIIDFELGISHPKKGGSLDSLMQRADQDMYHNKPNRRATD